MGRQTEALVIRGLSVGASLALLMACAVATVVAAVAAVAVPLAGGA